MRINIDIYHQPDGPPKKLLADVRVTFKDKTVYYVGLVTDDEGAHFDLSAVDMVVAQIKRLCLSKGEPDDLMELSWDISPPAHVGKAS